MQKMSDELYIEVNGPFLNNNGDVWAAFPDKGYAWMDRKNVLISSKKKPVNRNLTFTEMDFNNNHATDRVLVETFSGRMRILWAMRRKKYRWTESNYEVIMKFCFALTNLHVFYYPLRDVYDVYFCALWRRLYHIGDETNAAGEAPRPTLGATLWW